MPANLNELSPIGPELRPEWQKRLVMDVALGTSTESILEEYGLVMHQFEAICGNPVFVAEVEQLRLALQKDGATFRLKSQLQADYYLTMMHTLIVDPNMDPRVRLRAIEDIVRWGGLDAPPAIGAGGGMGGFQININFGDHKERGIIVDNQP